jgi:hypothetical protein
VEHGELAGGGQPEEHESGHTEQRAIVALDQRHAAAPAFGGRERVKHGHFASRRQAIDGPSAECATVTADPVQIAVGAADQRLRRTGCSLAVERMQDFWRRLSAR